MYKTCGLCHTLQVLYKTYGDESWKIAKGLVQDLSDTVLSLEQDSYTAHTSLVQDLAEGGMQVLYKTYTQRIASLVQDYEFYRSQRIQVLYKT